MLYFELLPVDIRKYYYDNYYDKEYSYLLSHLKEFRSCITEDEIQKSKSNIMRYTINSGYLKIF